MRVLIPTAGNRSLLISAFREQDEVTRVITTEIDELAPGVYYADKCYWVPRSDDPSYPEALEAICRKEKIDLIVPIADLDLIRLVGERERFAEVGAKMWAAPQETVDLAMDKLATVELFCRLGIPTPKTTTLEQASQRKDSLEFPIYLKPRHAGMKNSPRYLFSLLEDTQDLEYFGRKLKSGAGDYLLQEPLLNGQEINADFFVQDKELKRLVTAYRLKAGDGGGIIRGRTIPCDPQIRVFVEKLVSQIEFHGAAQLQVFKLETGDYKAIEINARFSNSSVLCARPAGVDFFALTIDMLRGQEIVPGFDNYEMLAVTSAYKPILVKDDGVRS
jgi:carbamoyl-phosphate synthase large subunit